MSPSVRSFFRPCLLGVLVSACESPPPERAAPAPPAAPAPARMPSGEASPTASPSTASPSTEGMTVAEAIVRLTNTERSRAGLAPLRTDARLTRAAQIQAEQVARAGRLAHILPGAPYSRPEDRLAAAGYAWTAFGENLAFGASGAAAAVEGWMHSAPHRANVLSSAYTDTGTAAARDSSGRECYVQVFGKPAS